MRADIGVYKAVVRSLVGLVAALCFAMFAASAAAETGPPGSVLFNSLVSTAVPSGGTSEGQPVVNPFPRNEQSEPGVTRDPVTGALIAGAIDQIDQPLCSGAGTSFSPGACTFISGELGTSGVYLSKTGGASWTQPSFTESPVGVGSCAGRTIHTLPGYCDQNLESWGDPTLAVGPAIGPDGRFSWSNGSVVYYANIALPSNFVEPGDNPLPIQAVSRSMDDGAHWEPPVVVGHRPGATFADKDDVWADGNPNSPYFGNVYDAWVELANESGKSTPRGIAFTRSTDGGKTWSPEVRLFPRGNADHESPRIGTVIRTGPDGTVYLFWAKPFASPNEPAEQLLAISHNGGRSFGQPTVIPTNNPMVGFSTNAFWNLPSVDVNQATGAIYDVYAQFDEASETTLVKFIESDDGGTTWSAPITIGGSKGAENAFKPSVAVSPDGRHVFVAWEARTWASLPTPEAAGVVRQYAQYNLRTDGAWSGPQLLSTASGDPDGSDAVGREWIGDYTTATASNTTAWLTWTDTRNDAPCAAVDAFRSGTAPYPNPDLQCPPSGGQTFGNTDIYAGAVSLP